MADVSAADVKSLREKTGAGMMDCKKALAESGGNLEEAASWLRKKGLVAAAKRAGRVAAEGLIGLVLGDKAGAMVEVNSETDFVARNDQFQGYVRAAAGLALAQGGDVEKVKAATYPGKSHSAQDELTNLVATIGENMTLRRTAALKVAQGAVAGYLHNQAGDGLGKIGVLVALESAAPAAPLSALARQLAMHVAAAKPDAISADGLDPAAVARERDVLAEQARVSGKPDAIVQKMVEGRLRKYFEEVVLLEQIWIIDGESKVSKVIEAEAKKLGAPVKVAAMVRFALGEGIERESKDFAAEVAAQLGR
ncbi:MAG: elongation factor Ts [Alphaproteobacteria bacterium]|nr:elongation factor Ts [Alphaproteobacteria bacterium]